MFEISYTKARAYLNCPWLYKLKFVDAWKAPPSPEASLGLSAHKALERYHLRKLSGEEGILTALDEVWDRAGYKDAGQELEFYDRAKIILGRYVREIEPGWPGRARDVEREFIMDIAESGIKLRGTLDRVDEMPDGSLALIEYKTHQAAWSQERLRDDLQMTIYSHAAQNVFNPFSIHLFFFFVTHGKIVEVKREPQDWTQALQTLCQVKEGILARKFTPDTRYCPFCEMNKSCAYSTQRDSK